jgi:hypothetical protein
MSASKFSSADLSKIWRACLQSEILGRVDEVYISRQLGIAIQDARSIVKDMIEIGFYDPLTRHMDFSKLPQMQWSAPMTGDELGALIDRMVAGSI